MMNRIFPGTYLLALSFTCLFGCPDTGTAQMSSGDVAGRVQGPSGVSLNDATVTATDLASGIGIATYSDNKGEYFTAQLPVGSYVLSVSAPGFKQLELRKIVIHTATICVATLR